MEDGKEEIIVYFLFVLLIGFIIFGINYVEGTMSLLFSILILIFFLFELIIIYNIENQ